MKSIMIAVGIDLGTTYSCVAVWRYGKVEIIANDQGNRITPSYVAFADNVRYIGDAAKNQAAMNPQNTIFDVKRLIGRSFHDPKVQEDMKHWPFIVIEEDSKPKVRIEFKGEKKDFFPEEISAMILVKMKETAENYLGCDVKDAVITVPAYFNDGQRQSTKNAARIAGLSVIGIISEPTAGALAYGLDKNIVEEKVVLVYDIGGGTFDVSVLKIKDSLFEVLSTAGDTHLGGEDFDNLLVNYLMKEFLRKSKEDIFGEQRAMRRLRTAAEQAKRALSTMTEANVEVDALFKGIDFRTKISRARFEDLCLSLFESTLNHVTDAIECAKLSKSQIDEVVLIGGSTRIPRIQQLLQEYFGGKQLNVSLNPDEAVAYGAAVKAAVISGAAENSHIGAVVLSDLTPLSLGIRLKGGLFDKIIERNTRIPYEKEEIFCNSEDYVEGTSVLVYEGERLIAKDNNFLGSFVLETPKALKGEVKLVVTFKLDVDGILNVSAKILSTGKSNSITIKRDKSDFTEEMVNKMINEASRFREWDEIQREKLKARELLENEAYRVKHAFIKNGHKLSTEEERKLCREYYEAIFQWLDSDRDASKTEYEYKLNEFKQQCRQLLVKLESIDEALALVKV